MQQLGCNGTVLTSTQTRQAAANWATAAATAPISPQFPAAAGTAFIVQQSSTTQQSQFVQNQTNVAQTTYVYTNGPAPFLVGSATHHTTTSQVRKLIFFSFFCHCYFVAENNIMSSSGSE